MINIFSFFKRVGKLLGGIFGHIAKIIPESTLDAAIDFVEQAAIKFATNPERRAFVIKAMQDKYHVSESVARLATELAVTAVKAGIKKAGDEADEALEGTTP